MKSFRLKRGSWHHRLASVYGPMSEFDTSTNICSYFWKVLIGLWLALMLTFCAGTFLGFILGQFTAFLVLLVTGTFYVNDSVVFLLPIIGIAGIAVYIAFYYDIRENNIEEKEPGFIVQSFRSFKNKTCHRIEFDDEN